MYRQYWNYVYLGSDYTSFPNKFRHFPGLLDSFLFFFLKGNQIEVQSPNCVLGSRPGTFSASASSDA